MVVLRAADGRLDSADRWVHNENCQPDEGCEERERSPGGEAACVDRWESIVQTAAAAYTVVTNGPDDDFGYEGATLGVADFGGGGDFEGDAGVTALLV